MTAGGDAVLTLEPLIEAVRDGVEGSGWVLSGLQKTTSHEYAGRWEGETSRSAYLFFHRKGGADGVSIDVFLDETARGLEGNLALVLDGASIAQVGDPLARLSEVAAVACTQLQRETVATSPVALRLRLNDPTQDVRDGETELRIKIRITADALRGGPSDVSAWATLAVRAFERLLERKEVLRYLDFG